MNTTSNTKQSPIKSVSRCIIIVACVLIITGYILMSGSGSTELFFNPEIFSTRRVVIAPILCVVGYLLIIIGILKIRS